MKRGFLGAKAVQGETYFRWRGGDVSRLEGLSDAVFALALALLILSAEVPSSWAELVAVFESVPAFAACFAMLLFTWHSHYLFHRRYGFDDFVTLVWNAVLLFLVLVYVYPLKFLADALFHQWLGLGAGVDGLASANAPRLMQLYSAGLVAIFGIYWILYRRAWRHRDELDLDPHEEVITLSGMSENASLVLVGGVSLTIATLLPERAALAGLVYFAIGPARFVLGYRRGVRLEALGPPRS